MYFYFQGRIELNNRPTARDSESFSVTFYILKATYLNQRCGAKNYATKLNNKNSDLQR